MFSKRDVKIIIVYTLAIVLLIYSCLALQREVHNYKIEKYGIGSVLND